MTTATTVGSLLQARAIRGAVVGAWHCQLEQAAVEYIVEVGDGTYTITTKSEVPELSGEAVDHGTWTMEDNKVSLKGTYTLAGSAIPPREVDARFAVTSPDALSQRIGVERDWERDLPAGKHWIDATVVNDNHVEFTTDDNAQRPSTVSCERR